MATDYASKVFGKIDAECHLGQELHIMTSEAFNTRVLGIRMYRIMPSASGHIGYTRQGFMLKRDEISTLRDFLTEAMVNESLWEDEGDGMVLIKEESEGEIPDDG